MAQAKPHGTFPNDPQWYRDAVIYQLHVKAFADSNGDGIGDFRGLTEKLDYLESLGVTALWLLPFYPSPLRDDGYDIADYSAIHPAYGTMRDFNAFLREAHRRGLRVITELVINHTSDQHPWFQRAREARPGSKERDFYVWSDTTEKYKGVRIIFKDFEPSNWSPDPVAGAYFWHRFYAHQPDLNFDNPAVRQAIFQALDFWLRKGVDGLRLDAIPYLYEREGTSCENLPETHEFLKKLRRRVDEKFSDRMLLAEANQWPEDTLAYFGDGDECHMAFHFPLMPRLFMSIRMEDRYPIIDILNQTPPIPETAQWATFLRNHDELTLEMVTDRERDYMYQVYARDREMRINLGIRRRLAPLMHNDRRSIELMNGLLFSMPGTPVIYYGDEIGMGDNVYLGDRNGVRTPMQWNADRNAGFSRARGQRLYLPVVTESEYHYEAVNVEAQQSNPRSLLWWMRRLIALRKRYRAFGWGNIEFLYPSNTKVLAFLREYDDEHILVVANLSRSAQTAEVDLSRFNGAVPVELFGNTPFPTIDHDGYRLTLGPHTFYWFSLEPQRVESATPAAKPTEIPVLSVDGPWESVLEGRGKANLEALLPNFLKTRRWFGGKARTIQSVSIEDDVRIAEQGFAAHLLLLRVEYPDGLMETYDFAISHAIGDQVEDITTHWPGAVFTKLKSNQGEGLLYDAVWDERFDKALLTSMVRRRKFSGNAGQLVASSTHVLTETMQKVGGDALVPTVSRGEQSNTSVFFSGQLIMKLYRKLEHGINPDLEVGRFLTEKAKFPHSPPLAGALEYQSRNQEPMSVGILQGFVPNEGDAWAYTSEHLDRYLEEALATAGEDDHSFPVPATGAHPLESLHETPPDAVRELAELYMGQARLLGQRTAELHQALASDKRDPAFSPEPYTGFYQRAFYQGLRGQVPHVFRLLRDQLKHVPEDVKPDLKRILSMENRILGHFASIRDRNLAALRIRTHGDYHLGQVLYTGKDFVIIDFEGEPARSLSERRGKTSALRDVAGMLRSFHYASFAAAFRVSDEAIIGDLEEVEPWRRLWCHWTTVSFLQGYLQAAEGEPFLPQDPSELRETLDAFLLDKAIYELGYELNNRPQWLRIPAQGILEIVLPGGRDDD